jgi:dTMP kinase
MAGRFITLEGGEGTGKSTQARLLADYLVGLGVDVVTTREPGGTPFADDVRALLLTGASRGGPLAEALLFNAARADHLDRLIRPTLAAGRWVVCDRFADSTRAYQGAADGISNAVLDRLEAIVVGSTKPDLTLILDIDVATGLARAAARAGADAFEGRERDFHERLRQGFLAIARAEPRRCALIDASGSAEDVARRIQAAVDARLGPALHPASQ